VNNEFSLQNLKFSDAFKKARITGKTALILSTWFGTGLAPKMPGTIGSLAAIPLVAALTYLGTVYVGIALVVLVPLAVWSSHLSSILLKKKDPSEIVIDEVAGLLLTLFLLPLSWTTILSGFVFFRFFDILKPFPAGWADKRFSGGIGIVLDDLLAGIYGNLCVRFLLLFLY
jgi:phosphatidylglycerophosphatase A